MSSTLNFGKTLPPAGVCIYTIVSPDKLIQAVRDHKPLHEEKRWVSAAQHIEQARQEGQRVPIIFADARKCRTLIAWSTLDNVAVSESTDFSISKLYDIGSATRSRLRVLATRAPIPMSHVRPYVICKTPEFLMLLAQEPKELLVSKRRPGEQPLSASNAVNYWMIKGRPAENDFERMLKADARGTWRTRRPPRDWARGDRLFFWRAAPSLDVVGIGEFRDLRSSSGPAGESMFNIRYLSPLLPAPVGIQQLRTDPAFGNATFLKRGPAGAVFPLTIEQGERIYALVCRHNPVARHVWPGVPGVATPEVLPDVDTAGISATEGARTLVSHLRLERDRRVVEAKKRAVLDANGHLACEVCMFDFLKCYGSLGEGFCEVHHRKMLAKTVGERVTNLDDLAVVRSNCHRMLHRNGRVISIPKLRLLLSSASVRS